ncbi:hypothetical protein EDB92DRAFT_1819008 [Lactarius akahatsu]|uniref:Uncharacterized protein n=1 Tax=Lactarius akahatsu TaxID=416441 RepID=A0AAD4L8M0_9AGAM|nr:hypothetical protein EDB92DRAFT_1819008 [Lactarius akahatsu]
MPKYYEAAGALYSAESKEAPTRAVTPREDVLTRQTAVPVEYLWGFFELAIGLERKPQGMEKKKPECPDIGHLGLQPALLAPRAVAHIGVSKSRRPKSYRQIARRKSYPVASGVFGSSHGKRRRCYALLQGAYGPCKGSTQSASLGRSTVGETLIDPCGIIRTSVQPGAVSGRRLGKWRKTTIVNNRQHLGAFISLWKYFQGDVIATLALREQRFQSKKMIGIFAFCLCNALP